MAAGLFAIDLATLTKAADPAAKQRLLGALVDLFIAAYDACSAEDARSLGTLMAELIFDLDPETRSEFAARLARCTTAPRDLMVKLANDRAQVARPVLTESAVLLPEDLIEIAQSQSVEHLFALSMRPTLPAEVTAILLHRGSRATLLAAVSNPGAAMPQACIAALERLSESDAELMAALAARAGVEPKAAGQENEAQTDDALELSDAGEPQARHIRESHLLAAARARRSSEAIRCLAILSKQPEQKITAMLQSADIAALAELCAGLGFSGLTFEATAELCMRLSDASPHRILTALKQNRAIYW